MKGSAYDGEGRRKYLNQAEGKRFLEAIQGLPSDHAAFCLTLYYSGARPSEVLGLTSVSIEMPSAVLIIRCLKKRQKIVYRRIPIPRQLAEQLARMAAKSNTGKIWNQSRTTAWRIVKEVMERASISGVMASPKGLRHAFGVRAVTNQVPLTLLRNWMGHSRIETTAIYADVQDEEQREMMRRMW